MSQIFISYSSHDSNFVDALQAALEQNGFDVWVDREDIRGGEAWRASISQAIRSCYAFIAVLSPNAVRSKYVTKELGLAEKHDKLIIPVIYQRCEIPQEVELQLEGLQWVDFVDRPSEVALGQLLSALRAKSEPGGRIQPPPPPRPEPTLAQILPGTWQVQLNVPTPFGVVPGQMTVEMYPNGSFASQSPVVYAQGQWSITPTNQLVLAGTQSNGLQMAPYQVIVQFTQVSHSQLNGYTSGNEMTFWQRVR